MTTTLEEVEAEAQRLEDELAKVRERARKLAQGIRNPVTLEDLPRLQRYLKRKKKTRDGKYLDVEALAPTGNENVALMRATIPRIRAEYAKGERAFNMQLWFRAPKVLRAGEEPACGTQACLAGWAIIMSLTGREMLLPSEVLKFGNGRQKSIRTAAQERLGLNQKQADFLFMSIVGARLDTIIEACSYVFGEDFR